MAVAPEIPRSLSTVHSSEMLWGRRRRAGKVAGASRCSVTPRDQRGRFNNFGDPAVGGDASAGPRVSSTAGGAVNFPGFAGALERRNTEIVESNVDFSAKSSARLGPSGLGVLRPQVKLGFRPCPQLPLGVACPLMLFGQFR
jgi:hypothetical protein